MKSRHARRCGWRAWATGAGRDGRQRRQRACRRPGCPRSRRARSRVADPRPRAASWPPQRALPRGSPRALLVGVSRRPARRSRSTARSASSASARHPRCIAAAGAARATALPAPARAAADAQRRSARTRRAARSTPRSYTSAALHGAGLVPRVPARRLRQHDPPLPGPLPAARQRPAGQRVPGDRPAGQARPADRAPRDPADDRRDDPGRPAAPTTGATYDGLRLRELRARSAGTRRPDAADDRRARRARDRRRLDGRLRRDEHRAGQSLPLRHRGELAGLLQRPRRRSCTPTGRSSRAWACTPSSTAATQTTSPTRPRTRRSPPRCAPPARSRKAPSTPANTAWKRSKPTSRACSCSPDAPSRTARTAAPGARQSLKCRSAICSTVLLVRRVIEPMCLAMAFRSSADSLMPPLGSQYSSRAPNASLS